MNIDQSFLIAGSKDGSPDETFRRLIQDIRYLRKARLFSKFAALGQMA